MEGNELMSEAVDLFSLTPRPTNLPSGEDAENPPSDSSATQQLVSDFQKTLSKRIQQVEENQLDAQEKMRQFAAGEIDNVHEVTVAMQKANMSVNLATLVRQKFMDAYERLQNLQ